MCEKMWSFCRIKFIWWQVFNLKKSKKHGVHMLRKKNRRITLKMSEKPEVEAVLEEFCVKRKKILPYLRIYIDFVEPLDVFWFGRPKHLA